MLNSEGRVVLKVYAKDGALLLARPCTNQAAAEEFWEKYRKVGGEEYSITPMVLRI